MRFISILSFLIFAYTATFVYASPMFGQERSKSPNWLEKVGLSGGRKTPPPGPVGVEGLDDAVKKFIAMKTFPIAKEDGVFEIWKSLHPFENKESKANAVIKIIFGQVDAAKKEADSWLGAGYLLAHTTKGSATYLILRVDVPRIEKQKEAQQLMKEAIDSIGKSGVTYCTGQGAYQYRENFRWEHDHAKGWVPTVFNWVEGWKTIRHVKLGK